MTPTKILSNNGLRITSTLPLSGARGGGGAQSGAGVFAIPAPGGGGGAGATDLSGAPSPAAEARESKTDAAKGASETDEGDKGEAAEEFDEAAGSGEGGEGEGNGDSAGATGQGGVQTQPLTIHTLNGLLLTLPATASPTMRAGGSARGAGRPEAGSGSGESCEAGREAPQGGTSTASRGNEGAGLPGGADRTADERGRSAGREQAGRDTDQPVARQGAPAQAQAARGRAAEAAPERGERVTGVNTSRADAAAAPARTVVEPKLGTTIGLVGGVGRGASIGEMNGAQRNTDPAKRPSVPTDRTGPAQVVRGVLAAVNQRGGKVTLDLEPGELGRMKVELKLGARTATATFHVNSPEARRLLEDALPQLRQSLTDRGVSLERAEVVATPTSGQELPGALAAIQAGAEAVAMVVPAPAQELDVRQDAKRWRDGSTDGESGGGGGGGGGSERTGGDTHDATDGSSVRVTMIGPDGVDVMA